jgi:hypothetical protein
MSEENEPQKTTRPKKLLVAAIVRWFFAAIFAVLLILAIVFQTAWKIIALFAILVAGLTLLPKSYRKWFYAAIGAAVLTIVIWVFLPDNSRGWRPYTFDKEIAALNAKYAVPNEENAAVIYNQLPKLFDDPCVAYIFEDSNSFYKLSHEPWTADDYPKYAEWLDNHQQIINLLLQTTRYERCYFSTKADIIMDDNLGKLLSPARRAAQLLVLAANYDIGKKKFDESLAKYNAVMHIGDHFQQNPNTINKLVGIAIEALAISRLREFIIEQNITPEQIKQAEEITSQTDWEWKKCFSEIIEYEKLFLKNSTVYYYEINSQGRTRLARDPWRRWREYYKKQLETAPSLYEDKKESYESFAYPSYLKKKLWKANTLLLWLTFPSNPQTVGQIIDNDYQPYYDVLNPDYDWQKEPEGTLNFSDWPSLMLANLNFKYYAKTIVKILEPNFRQIHRLYLRIGSDKRGTLLLAALKLYKNKNGSWPDSLEQIQNLTDRKNLIDPRSNGPFAYHLTNDSFELYSIGPNKIDEGGEYKTELDPNTFESTTIHDDWPIWPPSLEKKWKNKSSEPNDTSDQSVRRKS